MRVWLIVGVALVSLTACDDSEDNDIADAAPPSSTTSRTDVADEDATLGAQTTTVVVTDPTTTDAPNSTQQQLQPVVSCVTDFDLAHLMRRSWAFDGTMTESLTPTVRSGPEPPRPSR